MVDLPVVQPSLDATSSSLLRQSVHSERKRAHRLSASFSGSIFNPNLTLPSVYSCPFQTLVSSGRVESFDKAACISSGVPVRTSVCVQLSASLSRTLEEAAASCQEEGVTSKLDRFGFGKFHIPSEHAALASLLVFHEEADGILRVARGVVASNTKSAVTQTWHPNGLDIDVLSDLELGAFLDNICRSWRLVRATVRFDRRALQ
jgi:hypothetical protein